jgi:hypothetical protein
MTALRARMGRDYQIDWEVVEHEPPTRQRIESTSGPFPMTLLYELTGGSDGTSVVFSVTGRTAGLTRLMEPVIARTSRRNLDAGFARLKELLESRR